VLYLDHNATTPVHPRVVEALVPYLAREFGNPSSSHEYGPPAAAALARARAQVSAVIGAADPAGIVFTGSGSEADALAVRGTVLAALAADPDRWSGRRPRVITQATEHPAVLHACRHLERWHDVRVTVLPVDGHGRVRPDDLAAALDDDTALVGTVLVSVMHANNETGTVQDIATLASLAHQARALFHTDAAQTVGKIPVDVTALDVDLLTLVGHKMYAPKGVGALYVRDGVRLEPLIGGGGQERGLRAGTENVAYAVALGEAARLAADDLATGLPDRLRALRDHLQHQLEAALPDRVQVNGHPEQRLPHTLNISIDGVTGETLLAAVPQLAASTGSACHSGRTDPSAVLTAMGVPRDRALAAVRLSLGRATTVDDVERAARLLAGAASGRETAGS
jgi:cysteine desulfurase